MKQKLSLPFAVPETLCYPHVTFAHSILKGNMGESFDALMCERYINCCYKKTAPKGRFHNCVSDHWSTLRGVVDYQKVGFLKEVWQARGLKIEQVLKACLNEEAYPFCQCPRYVTEGHPDTNTSEFDCVITGYDDEKGSFLVKGFDTENNYHDYEIPYGRLETAILQSHHKGVNFDLWSYHKGVEVTLDIAKITAEISDYLNGTVAGGVIAYDKYFGVEAINALITEFEATISQGDELNKIYLRGFYEHKYFMKKMIALLATRNLISQQFCDCATAVEVLGSEVLALGTEYNQLRTASLSSLIIEKMRDSMIIEKKYLSQVLSVLN